ncbi:MAG: DUF4437 domain-containing protein [Woeseiaceae bacterium]|nr:DUF4437 domain-containing protein [Woeseiaceae bacterium]
MPKTLVSLPLLLLLSACASGPPEVPYPAFVQVGELEDVFMATLPGIRAKQLAGDPQTRRTSNRINLPPQWTGTTGGMPGRSIEIFVLAGTVTLADIELTSGGYAYLPAGSLGFNMETLEGAQVLYFVNDLDPEAVIRSPILIDAELLEWDASDIPGVMTKELRSDPGTGARTWLMRIDAGTSLPWQSSSAIREGYLVSGNYQHTECVLGEEISGQYTAGGYFYRPAAVVNGGPLSGGATDAVWFMREISAGTEMPSSGCDPESSPAS